MSLNPHSPSEKRPFFSYVLTQSSLVLVVLAASYLLVELSRDVLSIAIERYWITLILVVLTQIPVAMLYARNEMENMTSAQGWVYSAVFVTVFFGFELGLQFTSGHLFATLGTLDHMATQSSKSTIGIVVCGALLLVLISTWAIKVSVCRAVRCNLMQVVKKDAKSTAKSLIAKPGKIHDYAGLYRKILLSGNIAVFGIAMTLFTPSLLHILKVSVPMSIVFAVFCVANQMARTKLSGSLSARCLNVSVKLLPMTLTSLLLLGISETYLQWTYVNAVLHREGLLLPPEALQHMLLVVGLLFSLCLAANTLMLVFFNKLIRPLVLQTASKKRPVGYPLLGTELSQKNEQIKGTKVNLRHGVQVASQLGRKESRTKRPKTRVFA